MDPSIDTQAEIPTAWRRLVGVLLRFTDQGLVSLGNFAVGVLGARTLGPGGYGQFALVWTVWTFSILWQWAFIIAPMQSSIPTTSPGKRPDFHAALLVHSFIFGLLAGVLAAALYLVSMRGAATLLGLCTIFLSFVFLILQDFTRRWLLVTERPAWALLSDAVRHVGSTAALLYLWHRGAGLVPIVGVIGCASVLATLPGLPNLFRANWSLDDIIHFAKDHARSGRVLLPFITVQSVIATAPIYVLSAFVNTAAAAGYRVAMTLTTPVIVVTEALETFLPLRAAQEVNDPAAFKAFLRRWRVVVFLGSGSYTVLMIVFAHWLVLSFFGPGYERYIALVYPLAIASLLQNLVYIRQVELRAKFILKQILYAEICAGLLLGTAYMVISLGSNGLGAAIAAMISQAGKLFVLML